MTDSLHVSGLVSPLLIPGVTPVSNAVCPIFFHMQYIFARLRIKRWLAC